MKTAKQSVATATGFFARNAALDGLRGIAIIVVVLGHFFFQREGQDAVRNFSPLLEVVFEKFGWGVCLFFVISGFLIGGILIKNRASVDFVKAFFVRRILRIWPLYYFLVVFVLGGVYLAGIPVPADRVTPFWSYFLFLQNFWKSGDFYQVNQARVTWSLAIEEQFYLLAPLLLIAAGRCKVQRVTLLSIVIAAGCRFISLLPAGVQIPVFGHVIGFHYREHGFFSSIDMITIGVFGASLVGSPKVLSIFSSFWARYSVLPILAVLLSMAAISSSSPLEPWLTVLGPDVIAFLFLGLVILVVANEKFLLSRILSSPFLTIPGKYCFFIYLFHVVMLENSAQLLEQTRYNGLIPVRLLALAFTFFAAGVSWKLIEFPLSNWARRTWPYQVHPDCTLRSREMQRGFAVFRFSD